MNTEFDDLLGKEKLPDQERPSDEIPLVTSAINAPTVFADGVWFCSNISDVIRITFLENILEPVNAPSPGQKSRHVGTLAMPRQGFKNMIKYLVDMDAKFDEMNSQNADVK